MYSIIVFGPLEARIDWTWPGSAATPRLPSAGATSAGPITSPTINQGGPPLRKRPLIEPRAGQEAGDTHGRDVTEQAPGCRRCPACRRLRSARCARRFTAAPRRRACFGAGGVDHRVEPLVEVAISSRSYVRDAEVATDVASRRACRQGARRRPWHGGTVRPQTDRAGSSTSTRPPGPARGLCSGGRYAGLDQCAARHARAQDAWANRAGISRCSARAPGQPSMIPTSMRGRTPLLAAEAEPADAASPHGVARDPRPTRRHLRRADRLTCPPIHGRVAGESASSLTDVAMTWYKARRRFRKC